MRGTIRSTISAELQRIIDEADRLTSRVDEILSAQATRAVPEPQIFDPEEAVLHAVDTWGPRLHHTGVTLSADLHPTDEDLARSVRKIRC